MRQLGSTYDSNSIPDSSHDTIKDSGYNSQSNGDSDSDSAGEVEAVDVEQMIQEFEEEGVTLSNPCDATKRMMEAELERWEE